MEKHKTLLEGISKQKNLNKNNTITNDNLARIKEARMRAGFSICLNLFLATGKAIAGYMGNSSALMGDAVHSGTDVIASSAAFMGLWLAGKKHPSFPYGLYKAETMATLIISIAVILAGYEIGRQAILGPSSIPDIHITLPVAIISLFIAFCFGFYQLYQSRRLNSTALEADAKDYIADGLSTGLVVFSLVLAGFGIVIDKWATGAVALFIFWSGGHLLWRAVLDLMDEAIDRETERKIIALVMSHPRVEDVERCLSRTAGGGRFIVDLDVVVRSKSHELAHRISHNLESEICRRFQKVIMARIKTHVGKSKRIKRITPVNSYENPHPVKLAQAPWFLIETIDRDKGTVDVRFLKNPYLKEKTKKGYLLGRWLLGHKPDQIVLTEKKTNTATALLEEAGVELIVTAR